MTYFLLIYFLFLFVFIAYSSAGIYHLWRFGYLGDLTKPVIVIYTILSFFIIISSLVLIATREWPSNLAI